MYSKELESVRSFQHSDENAKRNISVACEQFLLNKPWGIMGHVWYHIRARL